MGFLKNHWKQWKNPCAQHSWKAASWPLSHGETAPRTGQRAAHQGDFRAEGPNCLEVPGFIHLEITQCYFCLTNVAVVTVCMGQLLCISHKQQRTAPRRFAVRLTVWNLAFQQIVACTEGLEDLLNLTERKKKKPISFTPCCRLMLFWARVGYMSNNELSAKQWHHIYVISCKNQGLLLDCQHVCASFTSFNFYFLGGDWCFRHLYWQ